MTGERNEGFSVGSGGSQSAALLLWHDTGIVCPGQWNVCPMPDCDVPWRSKAMCCIRPGQTFIRCNRNFLTVSSPLGECAVKRLTVTLCDGTAPGVRPCPNRVRSTG